MLNNKTPGMSQLVDYELSRVRASLKQHDKDMLFERMEDYGEVADMLPTKPAVENWAVADMSDIARFDPNDGATDFFAALGPIYFFNASVTMKRKETVSLVAEPGSGGYGFTISGNRPVW